ncbi:hypothetical protein ABPG72_012403 [Tetrahymena utriculariae]
MMYSKLDLFSTSFTFNIENHQMKRGTLIGTILSFSVFIIKIPYFVYIIQQQINNQIKPTFGSQSFIENYLIEVNLSSSLLGFRFEYCNNLNQQQISQDKTYLVYLAFLFTSSPDNNQLIPLKVIECTDPNLLGFKCLDFSNIANNKLFLNTKQNQKSSIQILTYRCLDIDSYKTSIPDNCAKQAEIGNMINGVNSVLRFKMYTSQYNTTSQSEQVNYRNAYIYTVASQFIITQLKIQKQNTSIKQGLVVQSESNYSSPIQYTQQELSYDRQYALKQVGGSAYRIFGRIVSQHSLQRDFFILFLKNIYQNAYLIILQNNKLIKYQQGPQSDLDQQGIEQYRQLNIQDLQNYQDQPLSVHNFDSKQKIFKDKIQLDNTNQNFTENKISQSNAQQQIHNQFQQQGIIVSPIIQQINQDKQNINVNIFQDAELINQESLNTQRLNLQKDAFIFSQNSNLVQSGFKNKNSQPQQQAKKVIFSQKQIKDLKDIQLKKVEYQVTKDLNILNFVNDVILLKKAEMILLTEHQLAALQFIGCSSSFLELNLSNVNNNLDHLEKSHNLNPYEMQFTIQQQQRFQEDQILNFVTRCTSNNNISKIDYRILSSIKKCHQI